MSTNVEFLSVPSEPYHHQLLQPATAEYVEQMLELEFPQLKEASSNPDSDTLARQIAAFNDPALWELAFHAARTQPNKPAVVSETVVKPNSESVRDIAILTSNGIVNGVDFLESQIDRSLLSPLQQLMFYVVSGFHGAVTETPELNERARQVFGDLESEGNLSKVLEKQPVLIQQTLFLDMLRVWSKSRFKEK